MSDITPLFWPGIAATRLRQFSFLLQRMLLCLYPPESCSFITIMCLNNEWKHTAFIFITRYFSTLFPNSLSVSSSMKEPKVHIQPKLSQVTVVNVKLVNL